MYVCICICIYVCENALTCIHGTIHFHVCMCVCMHAREITMYVCLHVSEITMYVCMYVSLETTDRDEMYLFASMYVLALSRM